jgi:phosphatidylglycerol lysyltransferase
LTPDLAVKKLAVRVRRPVAMNYFRNMAQTIIEGEAAKSLGRKEKWNLLSPFLREHGREALSYATLQSGLEYFINPAGYIAYTTVRHPVFARKPKRIALSNPICAERDYEQIVKDFTERNSNAVFACISEPFAEVLRDLKFKVNCLGYECELPIQTYKTKGDWKEFDLIKRARNEARRENIAIREEQIETIDRTELEALSQRWIGTKKVNDREIWIYARRAIYEHEEGVRKFIAYDRDGRVAGYAFYDPMYRGGKVFGYSSNILRCDESRFGRLATAMHMEAIDKFRCEGAEVLNLNLAPFVKLEQGRFNDDLGASLFFKLSARYGDDIYNFKGLSFHKSKYRGAEKCLYFASNSFWPSNDIYLAFLSADITRSYFDTLGRLILGMLKTAKNAKSG